MALKIGNTTVKKVNVVKDGVTTTLKKIICNGVVIFTAELLLYNKGVFASEAGTLSQLSGAGAVTLNTDNIYVTANGTTSTKLSKNVDVTGFDTLSITYKSTMSNSSGYNNILKVKVGNGDWYTKEFINSANSGGTTFDVDISGISGSRTIYIDFNGHELAWSYFTVTKILLH